MTRVLPLRHTLDQLRRWKKAAIAAGKEGVAQWARDTLDRAAGV